MFLLDEREAVEEFGEAPGDLARKNGFLIKVQEIYKWKNVPVAKVLFHDFQRFAEKYRSGLTSEQTMASFFSVFWLDAVEGLIADQEVSCIIENTHIKVTKIIMLSVNIILARIAMHMHCRLN